ncbi:DUF3237 domain-containing protein [Paraburkholderia sp.]|uniref:DUF3237 domain-containing protein n=1 Tax=Paraburkholderia sp. TaxID=1926495 RepID=UPI00239F33BA|nr:DUF3237 domain-containing protein [Paraburkholderia sp.]MDE1182610.1 DUF3237 domain-containing protein [Paraburkholderia sp.]
MTEVPTHQTTQQPGIEFEYVATIDVQVGTLFETGMHALGNRRLIPITAGTVSGPRLNGRILDGGADSQIVRADGQVDLSARYMIETVDGARIYIENDGVRRAMTVEEGGAPGDAQAAIDGSSSGAAMYFRTVPTFETASPDYRWLTQSIFVCSGTREPTRVLLHIYRVK